MFLFDTKIDGEPELSDDDSVSSKKDMRRQSVNEERDFDLYKLVDTNSHGGELVNYMWRAAQTGNYAPVDEFLNFKLQMFMYNKGRGRLEPIAELVNRRNQQRIAMRNKKLGKTSRAAMIVLDEFEDELVNDGDMKKALKFLDGNKDKKSESRYREVVWKFEYRGRMGENVVGACLMQGSAIHNRLAIRIITAYPALVNDVFISEEYYGLSHLHQAIVNENPYMVRFLLLNGADIGQRCYGAFFCADDQKAGRFDSIEHEHVHLPIKTNYEGRMYFGEYPLAFAACTNQEDCYRLLLAKGANPNWQDTNGNTVLHMTVIHENKDMLKLTYDTGGKLQIMNRQNLTPLTLAVKMAKKKMFEQILGLESTVVWTYGDAYSVAYPIAKIDTINEETGELNEDSALFLAAYGETKEHLEMLDGLLEDLLQAKWDSFARTRWRISIGCFIVYAAFVYAAFMNRPFSLTTSVITDNTISIDEYGSGIVSTRHNITDYFGVSNTGDTKELYDRNECHLNKYIEQHVPGHTRLVSESFVILGAMFQVFTELTEMHSIGLGRWWQVLRSFPFKILYRMSLILTMLFIPIRINCHLGAYMLILDNLVSILIVLMTGMHFLFYMRAIKFVGPFVVMICTIFQRDMSRFVLIYIVFLFGFSQSFYLIFVACERENSKIMNLDSSNLFSSPVETMMRLFISTLGEFTVFYKELNGCNNKGMATLGKIVFVVFQVVVSLTQFNMLIAMMTRTYEIIYRTQKEYKRQWAQVILMLELSLPPKDRLTALLKYSRPLGTDQLKRSFVVVKKQQELSKPEMELRKQKTEALREEKRMLLKRRLRQEGMYHINDKNSICLAPLKTPMSIKSPMEKKVKEL